MGRANGSETYPLPQPSSTSRRIREGVPYFAVAAAGRAPMAVAESGDLGCGSVVRGDGQRSVARGVFSGRLWTAWLEPLAAFLSRIRPQTVAAGRGRKGFPSDQGLRVSVGRGGLLW